MTRPRTTSSFRTATRSAHLLLDVLMGLLGLGCGAADGHSGPAANEGGREPAGEDLALASVPTLSVEVAPMAVARAGHTATLLADGTLVVIGGEDLLDDRAQLASVERYDPASDTWSELPLLPEPRVAHSATLLADGRILVVGGGRLNGIGMPSGLEVRSTALLIDPDDGSIESLPGPADARHGHAAVRLPSGRVLVAGGSDDDSVVAPSQNDSNPQPFGHPLATAELFDPATRRFQPAAAMQEPRTAFVLVGLEDGRTLACGGVGAVGDPASSATCEVYDEGANAFTTTGAFEGDDRLYHGATRLADGDVLVACGKKSNTRFLRDLQRYAPTSGSFGFVGEVADGRTVPNVVPLVSGGALVLAGLSCSPSNCSLPTVTALLGPDGELGEGPALVRGRGGSTATVLVDGSILLVGGFGGPTYASLRSVERLIP